MASDDEFLSRNPASMTFDDEVTPLKYLDVYPKLPIDAPFGYPHIVDLDSLDWYYCDRQELSISDAVATILFKFSPGTLTAFLDLDRPNFLFIQGGQSGVHLDFCIKRDGRMVEVGFLNEKEVGGWDDQTKYRIDGKATEPWSPVSYQVGEVLEETDAKKILDVARVDAYGFLMHEPWHEEFPDQPIEVVCGLSHGRRF